MRCALAQHFYRNVRDDTHGLPANISTQQILVHHFNVRWLFPTLMHTQRARHAYSDLTARQSSAWRLSLTIEAEPSIRFALIPFIFDRRSYALFIIKHFFNAPNRVSSGLLLSGYNRQRSRPLDAALPSSSSEFIHSSESVTVYVATRFFSSSYNLESAVPWNFASAAKALTPL